MTELSSGEDQKKEFQNIISDFDRLKRDQEQKEQRRRAQVAARGKWRIVWRVLGAVIAVVLLGRVLVVLCGRDSPMRFPPPWAVGERRETDYRLDDCISRMWKVRAAVDHYYARHDQFPRRMADMYAENLLPAALRCPASGNEYVIKELYGEICFSCPEPHAHGDISELYGMLRSGPPVIERGMIKDEP